MIKDWRTTASGLAAAGFGFVLFSPQHFPNWLVDLSKYAMLGGLVGLGIAAQDCRRKLGKCDSDTRVE